jgi:hypothetical protein
VFDFRYHALSLVAVFLALAVGLLLGVAIGDSGLVSSAKQDIEASLRGDVRSARGQVSELQGKLDRHTAYEEQTYADLVAGRLVGDRVAVLFLGTSSDAVVGDVRDALEPTGAQSLEWVGAVHDPPDVAALSANAGPRYADLANDRSLLQSLAQRLGRQLASGGRLVTAERAALMPSFSGRLGRIDGLVVVRSAPPADADAQSLEARKALEDGLVRGLQQADVRLVGVETLDSDPSQVPWYRDHSLPSVDSVDAVWGRAALVFALAGADGSFGVKPTAEALLPRVVGGITRP